MYICIEGVNVRPAEAAGHAPLRGKKLSAALCAAAE